MTFIPANPLDSRPRIHGGPDGRGVPRYDFSTNSNACGPCPDTLAAVRDADAATYPDPGYSALRARLAGFHGVTPDRIALAASASEFIFRFTAVVASAHRGGASSVWLPLHGFGDYAQAAASHGLAEAASASAAQLRWACEPSSPKGALQAELAELAHAGFTTVLDRAYEPLRLEGELALTPFQLESIWQLWTPNKALGLTGVRAAYAIAPGGPDAFATMQALEQLCPSWPVGAHGVALLHSWTQPATQAWLAATRETLRHWKHRQIELCRRLGWDIDSSVANFFCARPRLPGAMPLDAVLQQLREQGLKLRDCTSFGLPGTVRLSVQPPQAQDALHNAWQSIVRTQE